MFVLNGLALMMTGWVVCGHLGMFSVLMAAEIGFRFHTKRAAREVDREHRELTDG